MPKTKTPPKEYAQGGDAATLDANPSTAANAAPQAPPDQPAATFVQIPLHALATSPTNPRKTFDAAKLQELADTIKASGVHTPILVRPLSADRRLNIILELNRTGQRRPDDAAPDFEIVAGERRYRASKLAHVPTIPAMVRNLTDHQVLEIQLIENLQRDDLSALEEAGGYNHLLTETGISAVNLAGKIGKSVRYVFNRLKLLDCCPEVQTALREGHIDTSRALLLATVPSAVQQKRGLAEALLKTSSGEPVHGLRALTEWVKNNLMLKIADATFSTTSASLVPAAGSCTQCPKRTGANADLFDDIVGKNTPDLCTDTACWSSKAEAHRDALLAKARATGQKIIEGAEAQEITNKWHDAIEDYTALKDTIEVAGSEKTSVRDYIAGQKIDVVIVENPFQKTFTECVANDSLDGLMRQRGHLGGGGQQGGSGLAKTTAQIAAEIDKVNNNIKALAESKCFTATQQAAIEALHARDESGSAKLWASAEFLRAHLHNVGDIDGLYAEELGIGEIDENLDEADAIAQHINRSPLTVLHRIVLATIINGEHHGGTDATNPVTTIAAQLLNVKTEPLQLAAGAEAAKSYAAHLQNLEAELKTAQTREAAQAKAEKSAQKTAAKPPKPPTKNAPLAQPEGAGGGKAQPAAKAGKPKAAPKPKTTAQEAITGIADALQNIEAPPADGAAPFAPAPAQPKPKAAAKAGVALAEEPWPFPHAKKP